jgi:Predicted membrane protein (DUF2157)
MTVLERLGSWRTSGTISPTQYSAIAAIVRKDRFSVFVELNALLYLGVISCIAGLGWTIKSYFENLGDVAIIAALTLLCGATFYYCFSQASRYSPQRVESPSLAFDYVLYLGALAFAVELGYIEFRFQVMKGTWDNYLLASAVLYFFLAYRFDNRFVLSLALSTLAGWFGLSFSRFGILRPGNYREPALLYALVVTLVGAVLWRSGLKQHFLRTYLHIAANVFFVALVSGVLAPYNTPYLLVLLFFSGIAIYGGFRFREFAFAAYGTIYGYIGVSIQLLHNVREGRTALEYLVVSGALVVAFIAWLAVKSGREK